MKDPKHKGESR